MKEYIRNSKDDDVDCSSDVPSDDGEARAVMDAATTENYSKWKFGCEYKCKMCDTVLFSWSHLVIQNFSSKKDILTLFITCYTFLTIFRTSICVVIMKQMLMSIESRLVFL